MKAKVLLTIFMVGCFAALGFSQITKTSHGYLFRYKYVKGRKYTYTFTGSIATPGSSAGIKVDGPFIETVNSVKGTSGQLTITLGPLSSGGKQAVAKVVRIFTANSVGGVADKTVQQMLTQYPEKPIKPGDTWTGQTSAAAMGSKSLVKAKYKFEKMTTVNGKPAAQIAMTMTSTGAANASGGGTLLVLAEDGSLWSTQTSLSMSPPQDPGKVMHMKMGMTRH
ncbi:MAG TPA: hypothetical protein VGL56_15520 [Fimbriimonadaceae bacterium]|jgi:hypothetical protein